MSDGKTSESWLSTQQAARRARAALPTILQWIRNRRLVAQKQGRCWMVSAQSLEDLIATRGDEAAEGYILVSEVARHYKVSQGRLQQALKQKQLTPVSRSCGRYWRQYLKRSEVEAWVQQPPPPRATIQSLPSHCPSDGPAVYTLAEACKALNRSPQALRLAIRKGHLAATKSKKSLRLSRVDLDRWLQRRHYLEGATEGADQISLSQAARRAGCGLPILRKRIATGTFRELYNPAGVPVLDRKEFEDWLAAAPPRSEDVQSQQPCYTLQQLAKMLQFHSSTLLGDIHKGLLEGTRVSKGQRHYWVVSQSQLRAWMDRRHQQYHEAPLRGEPLTTRQVCQRFSCTYDQLKPGVELGLLPVTRRFGRNGISFIWGADDVADYLRLRAEQVPHWTPKRIEEFTGINSEAIRLALAAGELPHHQERILGRGLRRVVSPEKLLEWMNRLAPPYRLEVAHLSGWLSPSEAERHFSGPPEVLRSALQSGELGAIRVGADQLYIPRYQWDRWLQSQGLPPSWELEVSSEWLTLASASKLCGLAPVTLQKWVTVGRLTARRAGRRWLVNRQKLSQVLSQCGPQAIGERLSPEQAAERYQVKLARLMEGIQSGRLPSQKVLLGRYWRPFVTAEDVQAWLKLPPPPPKPAPKSSLPGYRTVGEAAELCDASQALLRREMARGALASRSSERGMLIAEKDLEEWAQRRFHRSGGTDDPSKISLDEAARQIGCHPSTLRGRVENGSLAEHRNPEGVLILDRAEFEHAYPQRLEAGKEYLTLKEIAARHELSLSTLQIAVNKGSLPALRLPGRSTKGHYVVERQSLQTWLSRRRSKETTQKLRGEVLTAHQAQETFGLSYDVLKRYIDLGLPSCRRFSQGALLVLVGEQDLREFLESIAAREESAWTSSRIVAVTGVSREAVREAMEEGRLQWDRVHLPQSGPRRVVRLLSLIEWLKTSPPYRKEVAHLSPVLSSKVAGKLSGLGQTSVVKALRAGEMQAIQIEADTGPRYYIPRKSFDLWLQQRGLAPSWQLEQSDWIRVSDAAQLVGLAKPTIQKWLTVGKIPKQRLGRRWLVHRPSLLEAAERYRQGS